jgi:integrase
MGTVRQGHIRPAARRAGVELRGWHTFRHTYRAILGETDARIGVQQKLMRHAQISTTMNTYGNASTSAKRKANSKVVEMVLPRSMEQGFRSSKRLMWVNVGRTN